MSDQIEEKETQNIENQLIIQTTNSPTTFSPYDYDQQKKRPRYTPIEWKTQTSNMGQQSPTQSPKAQLITSPSDSPSSSSAQLDILSNKQQFRKGKYVSPVWKPHEMLWLAKAWRAQCQGEHGIGPATIESGGGGSGRGKSRAEKDKEVAEFLARNGVNRDAKTAGTKWDNMLGEFRKVFEWEKSSEKSENEGGKSYFRLSPYERKLHRLPASFDEQVFQELSHFMGPRMRPISNTSSISGSGFGTFQHGLIRSSSGSDFVLTALHPPPPPLPALPLSSQHFCEDDLSFSSMLSARTRQMEQYRSRTNRRNPMLGYDPSHQHPLLDFGATPLYTSSLSGNRAELRRIGRMRMTWEESVSLWAEESEFHRGRVKIEGSSLFNNNTNDDELVYFDESMVVYPLECFEDGPLKGFSIDSFVPGQQLKVFGRKKSTRSITTVSSSGINDRFAIPIGQREPYIRWEFQDPTDHHLECLRVLPGTLPSLIELSWYIQEPPPDELRMPLRKDIYRDLPEGKELFFTTSSTNPLDCKSFTIDVLSSMIRSNPSISGSTSTSRDSYIGLWDDCINRVVAKFCPNEIVFVRKPPEAITSPELLQDKWPNLTGMVKNLCLWRGEEVDRIRESQPLDDPSSSITRKLSWTYKDLPYFLGYYAIGHNVTFCALSPSQNKPSSSSSNEREITRTDLYSIDLSNPSERLKSIIPCWRIGILLASLAEKCSKNCESDFIRQDLGDGNVIEMTPNTVTQFYPSKRTWQKVKEIYDMLDQRVPHSEHIISYNEMELSLVFKPRGINTKPKNCSQLVLALKQVTKALVALHDLSFMHRDLSWEKVVLKSKSASNRHSNTDEDDQEEWFMSGFEVAVGAPQINPRVTVEGSGRHAPEMARGVHGVKVDVWGVGYLVKTSGVTITKNEENVVGMKLRELEIRCMDQNPEVRPTAADCYHHLLQIQTSLLSSST